MQKTLHHPAARRHGAAAQSRNGEAAAIAMPASEDIVTVCAWCPELHVLHMEHTPGDVLFAIFAGGKVNIFRTRGGELGLLPATLMTISDGICDSCRAKHFPASAPEQESPQRLPGASPGR
jgi:hypothetical protein